MSHTQERIGYFGSSFDPVTLSHLFAMNTLAVRKKLDKIVMIPCSSKNRPDNKKMKTEDEHRWNMLQLAVKDNPRLEISDFEINSTHGIQYTCNTMRHFRDLKPDAKHFFIMGADLLQDLPKWDKGEQLIKEFDFIVLGRDGIDMEEVIAGHPLLRNNDVEGKFNLVKKGLIMEISSTYIREEFAGGGDPKYLMQEDAYRYALEHKLYTDKRAVLGVKG